MPADYRDGRPQEPRINDKIRAREVLLIGPTGEQLGVQSTQQALLIARELDLDLVEVAGAANPPVARLMDYGKFKYEDAQRKKEARKKQSHIVIKEMKFRPKIDAHDYETKRNHVRRFLEEGAKVKLTIMFRGRENTHPELGERILTRVADELAEIAHVEASPKLDGRNMVMVLAPTRKPGERRHAEDEEPSRGRQAVPADGHGQASATA